MTTVEYQVSASSDDTHETFGNSIYGLDGTLLYIGGSESWDGRWAGLRFDGVAIPQGATIDVAYIKMYCEDADFDCEIDCQASDDAPTFTTSSGNISGRTLTGEAVAWTEYGTDWGFNQSPSIVAPVQAVVDRPSWSSGNAIVVVLDQNSTTSAKVWSYDMDAGDAPLLHIEYTEAASGNPNYYYQMLNRRR